MAGRAEGSGTARHTCVLEAGSFAATAARCPPPPAAAHRRSLPPPRTNHPAARPALQGRYVTVVQHGGQLFCLDSICFHAGGPLGLGDLEELPGGQACLSCPWHYYLVSLDSGEKWYQGTVVGPDGRLLPGPWKSIGQRQRTHAVERRADGGIWVQLSTEGSLASDEYAHKQECGVRLQTGHLRLR